MVSISSCQSYELRNVDINDDDAAIASEYNNNYSSKFALEEFNKFYVNFELIHAWLCMFLCCCSLLANAFNVAVLTRRSMTSTINHLLIAVAVCDSCLSVSYFIFVLHFKFISVCPASQLTYSWTLFALVHANMSIVFRASSLWLSVIIAGYRKTILYLNQPNAREKLSTAPLAATLTIFAVSFVASPIFLGNTIKEELSPKDSECINDTLVFYQVVPSAKLYLYDCFLLKINHFINAVLLKFLPLCLLAYYLICVIKFLIKRNKFRRHLFANNPHDVPVGCWRLVKLCRNTNPGARNLHPTTIILSSILLMTLFCELPNAITSSISIFLSSEFFLVVYRNLGDLFDTLSLLNGLTTFIMYCTMSGSFRSTFVNLFQKSNSSQASKIRTVNPSWKARFTKEGKLLDDSLQFKPMPPCVTKFYQNDDDEHIIDENLFSKLNENSPDRLSDIDHQDKNKMCQDNCEIEIKL